MKAGAFYRELVISLYAKGMSVSDIEEEMREIYEIELSTSAISIITNKVNRGCKLNCVSKEQSINFGHYKIFCVNGKYGIQV